jgi:hypothetical protein
MLSVGKMRNTNKIFIQGIKKRSSSRPIRKWMDSIRLDIMVYEHVE